MQILNYGKIWCELNTLACYTSCDLIKRILVDNEGTQRTSLNHLSSMSIDHFLLTHIYVLLAIRNGDEQESNEGIVLYDEAI